MRTCKIYVYHRHTNGDDKRRKTGKTDGFDDAIVLHGGAHFVVTYTVDKTKYAYTVTHLRTGYALTITSKKVAVEMCDVWNDLFTRFRFDSSDKMIVRDFHLALDICRPDLETAREIFGKKIISEVNFDNGLCIRVERAKSTYGVEGLGDAY